MNLMPHTASPARCSTAPPGRLGRRAQLSRVTALLWLSLAIGCPSSSPPTATDTEVTQSPDAGEAGDTGDVMEGPCPGGTIVVVAGQDVCVAPNKATETGFNCPPDTFGYEGVGWNGCGPDGIDEEEMERQVIAQDGLQCGGLKLDVLLVMDNSTSMCEEQVVLAEAIQNFANLLSGYEADMHIAATTVDMGCDPAKDQGLGSSQGQFSTTTVSEFPLTCGGRTIVACGDDETCAAEHSVSVDEVMCIGKSDVAECDTNPNGTVNTRCEFRCSSDAFCQEQFGPSYECVLLGGDGRCVPMPDTAGCPETFGPVLTHEDADLIPCLAQTGVYAQKCFNTEQGLRAAWTALDPNGIRSIQSGAFLRPDAHLAIVFVSDEDDCSVPEGVKLGEAEYNTCAFLGDTTEGGPLTPVAELADHYRSLKASESMVSVMSIAGDSLAEDPAAAAAERQAFKESKLSARDCHQRTYICDSGPSTADWGSRYQAMTEAFGERGLFRNICAPEQIKPAFSDFLVTIKDGYLETCLASLQ